MKIELKPLGEQVVVITGASSGIGLATARQAARRGARVLLIAREETDLQRVTSEITGIGGQAIYAVADVADFDALSRAAQKAVDQWGGIDAWINDAGVSIYGEIRDVPVEDARRLFDTNYWGVVNGSLVALPHLERRGGGALVNVGSTLSDRAIPLQGHYSASKHAVKGFTDTLRMELEKKGTPVSVTLVKPGAIDTPYPQHARNYMNAEPKHPAPVYAPDVAADAILFCLEHPRRDITVGAGGKLIGVLGLTPRLADKYMEATQFEAQKRNDRPADTERPDTLYEPVPNSGRLRGDQPGHVASMSVYTTVSKHPIAALVGVAAVGAAIALVGTGRRRGKKQQDAAADGASVSPRFGARDVAGDGRPPVSAAALTIDPTATATTDTALNVEIL
ncbi:MAG TPA: SDR family oxidoreductase [Gemmatimonadaceae bacterium]|nr:SDR family oxidoreductase [Gemmatimonadaceae bacterium]